jgi:hypothetical protein
MGELQGIGIQIFPFFAVSNVDKTHTLGPVSGLCIPPHRHVDVNSLMSHVGEMYTSNECALVLCKYGCKYLGLQVEG